MMGTFTFNGKTFVVTTNRTGAVVIDVEERDFEHAIRVAKADLPSYIIRAAQTWKELQLDIPLYIYLNRLFKDV